MGGGGRAHPQLAVRRRARPEGATCGSPDTYYEVVLTIEVLSSSCFCFVCCVLCVLSTERCAMFALHGYAMKLMGVLEFSLELVRCVSYSGSGTWETPRETGHPPGCPT